MLTDSILSYAGNDDWFQIRLAEYKIKHGLDTTEREQVISLLADMGESVEGR